MANQAPPYIGNGHYCYANATAMLLSSVGEQVAAGTIEVLSGVGLGAEWLCDEDLFFFGCSAPDLGISRALKLLGWRVLERAAATSAPPPLDALASALALGPVILGPLDMGLLTYQLGRSHATGVDHYVLAFAIDETNVYVHDPAGFPHASLPLDELTPAWRAERLGSLRGAYRSWSAPRRLATPTDEQLVRDALGAFAELYREAAARTGTERITGSVAIRHLADRVAHGELPQPLLRHLVGFALPVAARRALDYAAFFERRLGELAAVKREQAALFGQGYALLARGDRAAAADVLRTLADTENRTRELIEGAAIPV